MLQCPLVCRYVPRYSAVVAAPSASAPRSPVAVGGFRSAAVAAPLAGTAAVLSLSSGTVWLPLEPACCPSARRLDDKIQCINVHSFDTYTF